MSPEDIANFKEWGVPLPSRDVHGIDDFNTPASSQLKSGNPRNWRMEGNKLIADTDFGELAQTIDTGYICLGTDSSNKPILKKIEV